MMKERILRNWNFMRFIRLALGIAIIFQSVMNGNWAMGLVGILFTAMPVFNLGCCGTSGCNTPINTSKQNTKDITYEEVV